MSLIALALLVLWVALIAAVIGAAIRVLAPDRHLDTTVEVDDARLRLRELTERKATLVELLRTTDDDLKEGKITDDVHRRTKRSLEREAVATMRAIEDIRGTTDDLNAADEALERIARTASSQRRASEGWSALALQRHGGKPPGTRTDTPVEPAPAAEPTPATETA